ncbi:MAG: hypothetical protein E7579_04400 [Ruminococcaceae bacterium]|nr:hypothetical protein [Oscillospiraceae bacterium]
MEDFVSKAIEKIEGGLSSVKGQKEGVVKRPVADALISFCRQQDEFAQAVVQSEKTFADCVAHVVAGCGNALSDIEAYRKAVGFWFPGAVVDMVLTIRMSEFEEPEKEAVPEVPAKPEKAKSQMTGNLEFSLFELL